MKPELPENTIYHVGVSGGKDSGAVLLWMVHKSGIPTSQIRASFCDTQWEHEWTYEQVEILSSKVHPIETIRGPEGFRELVVRKGIFPSAKRRFCTEFLKIRPTQDHLSKLKAEYSSVVAVSGVRANESDDRSKLEEWDYSGTLLCNSWRPLLTWTVEDVIAIHEEFGIPMNKLYAAGCERVGCLPCIMSRKKEIRIITQTWPERLEPIAELELETGSSFFHANAVPERFRSREFVAKDGTTQKAPTIYDLARWSLTGKGAKGTWDENPDEPKGCNSGFCE